MEAHDQGRFVAAQGPVMEPGGAARKQPNAAPRLSLSVR